CGEYVGRRKFREILGKQRRCAPVILIVQRVEIEVAKPQHSASQYRKTWFVERVGRIAKGGVNNRIDQQLECDPSRRFVPKMMGDGGRKIGSGTIASDSNHVRTKLQSRSILEDPFCGRDRIVDSGREFSFRCQPIIESNDIGTARDRKPTT